MNLNTERPLFMILHKKGTGQKIIVPIKDTIFFESGDGEAACCVRGAPNAEIVDESFDDILKAIGKLGILEVD